MCFRDKFQCLSDFHHSPPSYVATCYITQAAMIEMSMNYLALSLSLARLISPFISEGLNSYNNIFTEHQAQVSTEPAESNTTNNNTMAVILKFLILRNKHTKCNFKQEKYTLNTRSAYKSAVSKGAQSILRLSEISKLYINMAIIWSLMTWVWRGQCLWPLGDVWC